MGLGFRGGLQCHAQDFNRRLRQEQDEAYQASLAEDHERERARQPSASKGRRRARGRAGGRGGQARAPSHLPHDGGRACAACLLFTASDHAAAF